MSFLGELFPRPKVHEDSDASADGQRFRIGEIDLDAGVVQLRPTRPLTDDDEPTTER